MVKQKILLDVDNTIIYTDQFEGIKIRPYFKNFFYRLKDKYEFVFYTAASLTHVFNVCAVLIRDWGFYPLDAETLYVTALTCETCPMIIKEDTKLLEKCLDKAAEVMKCKVEDIYLHIDDHPHTHKWHYPEKRMWAVPYEYEDYDDTFFLELTMKFKKTGQLK